MKFLTFDNLKLIRYLKDLDIKCYDWPWCDEGWEDIDKFIIKMWLENSESIPKAYSIFRIVSESIVISKLAVHPEYRGEGIGTLLLDDIESTARRHQLVNLKTMLWEYNDLGIAWSGRKGFRATGIRRALFPDGTDGYRFVKELR